MNTTEALREEAREALAAAYLRLIEAVDFEMSDDNLDAWNRENNNRTYYALRLTNAYINGDTAEVERFADLFRKAEAELDRLNREYLGEQ